MARMKFSSQGMLTAERQPTENMTISLIDPFSTPLPYLNGVRLMLCN
jgi:hypothetical protein